MNIAVVAVLLAFQSPATVGQEAPVVIQGHALDRRGRRDSQDIRSISSARRRA